MSATQKLPEPYAVLSRAADRFWELSQAADGREAEQALAMYDALENVYLEPFRRKKIRVHTARYARMQKEMKATLRDVEVALDRIDRLTGTVRKIRAYAEIFDSVVAAAAKLVSLA
jgi:hypothetical protein